MNAMPCDMLKRWYRKTLLFFHGQQIGEMGYSTQNVWLPTIGLHFKKVNISVQIKLSNKALISFNSF